MSDPELAELHRHLDSFPLETVSVLLARFPLFFARLLVEMADRSTGTVETETLAEVAKEALVAATAWITVVPVNASRWLGADADPKIVDAFGRYELEEIAGVCGNAAAEAIALLPADAAAEAWVGLGTATVAGTLAALGGAREWKGPGPDWEMARAALAAVAGSPAPNHLVTWVRHGDDPTPLYVLCGPGRAVGTYLLQPAEVAFHAGAATPWDQPNSRGSDDPVTGPTWPDIQ